MGKTEKPVSHVGTLIYMFHIAYILPIQMKWLRLINKVDTGLYLLNI